MKLGLVARADNTGLGNQTYQFFKHMKPHKTMVVDISDLNGNPQHYERYAQGTGVTFVKGIPDSDDLDAFLENLDVVFLAEAPYNYALYTKAKEQGVKVACQYNYEFFDWFANPTFPKPDMLIAPSTWHYGEVDQWAHNHGIKHVQLHCPIDTEELQYRPITKAKNFLHVAGRPAAYDRNGTETVIQVADLLETDAKITIHFQGDQGLTHQATRSVDDYREMAAKNKLKNLNFRVQEFDDYREVYDGFDVMVLPRRYGGNCLPMLEAIGQGIPVIMTDVSPNEHLLPGAWLVPAQQIGQFAPRTVVDIYGSDPAALAAKIDEFANKSTDVLSIDTGVALQLRSIVSWDRLASYYRAELERLCAS